MKLKLITPLILAMTATLSLPAQAQLGASQHRNCALYAQMSADTVKKDSRFANYKTIAPSLMKFAAAQEAKFDAGLEDTYKTAKAFGMDKAGADQMLAQSKAELEAGFFTPTMDTSTLYMDHIRAVYSCAQKQSTASDLGQSEEELTATLTSMIEVVGK